MIHNFEFELELDYDNFEFTIPLDTRDVETVDGYDYRVDTDTETFHSLLINGEKLDSSMEIAIQGIIESMIAEDEDLADLRAEIDEAHNIVHEADGIPSLYGINGKL